jgi:TolB-like protein
MIRYDSYMIPQSPVMKKSILIMFLFFFAVKSLCAHNLTNEEKQFEKVRRTVMLLPIRNLTADEEYASLAYTIYNVFQINLKKQESLDLLVDEKKIIDINTHFDINRILSDIGATYRVETCVVGEYYVSRETLHITVSVVDVESRRIKNCYIKSMPADQGRYDVLDAMSSEISVAIARELPALEREAVVQKQITTRLRQKLDREERLLDHILNKHHEIRLFPLTGVNLGRTVISWAEARPSLFPPLRCEYLFFFGNTCRVTAGFEYLPFDLMVEEAIRTEIGLDILFGIYTRSLFSFGADVGLAFTYDNNTNCTALSSDVDISGPSAERFSLSIPIIATLSIYFDPTFFLSFRLAWYGLTYTIETLVPSHYTGGTEVLLYYYGVSPFNFLNISISSSIGVRF